MTNQSAESIQPAFTTKELVDSVASFGYYPFTDKEKEEYKQKQDSWVDYYHSFIYQGSGSLLEETQRQIDTENKKSHTSISQLLDKHGLRTIKQPTTIADKDVQRAANIFFELSPKINQRLEDDLKSKRSRDHLKLRGMIDYDKVEIPPDFVHSPIKAAAVCFKFSEHNRGNDISDNPLGENDLFHRMTDSQVRTFLETVATEQQQWAEKEKDEIRLQEANNLLNKLKEQISPSAAESKG